MAKQEHEIPVEKQRKLSKALKFLKKLNHFQVLLRLLQPFLFYHVNLIAIEEADSIFNLLDNESSNISFVHSKVLMNLLLKKDTNTYFFNSKKFNVEKIFINKSNVNYQRLFNNLCYVEIDSKNEIYLPGFSESFNHNWEI